MKLLRSTIVRRLSRPTGLLIAALCLLALVHLGYAGDILRGGVSSTSRQNADARAGAGAEAATVTKANAKDRLARTTQALASVQAMQAKARASAAGAVVPEGLQPGGLEVLTGANARWDGADSPTQSGSLVTIKQRDTQALLHWKTFNVGQNTTVKFDQSAGKDDASKWIAFNKVFDPSGKPSQIRGQIQAEGQVYIINQNGIIFGGGSQVNTRALVASSLPINDNLVQRGLLNNAASQFLFTNLEDTGQGDVPTFTPPAPLTPDGRVGDVIVESGATITSPLNAEGNGGRIMLVGANVSNSGVLNAPAGQVILAAGLQVGVGAHSTDDPSLRGLDVYVGQVGDYTAAATNSGIISIPRGNAFLTGKQVNQMGVIDSSTSVALNGRIDLIAAYDAVRVISTGSDIKAPFRFTQSGSVTFGPDSVTRILPESSSTEKTVGVELALPSLVNVQGYTINLAQNATILAPGARLPTGEDVVEPLSYLDALQAGVQLSAGTFRSTDGMFMYSGGQVFLAPGSLIDASGTAGAVSQVNQNILNLSLRSGELADSPLQRDGFVRGLSITVDVRRTGTYNGRDWVGTPLADVTGFADLIERTVDELTVAGGTVQIKSGGSFIAQKGSIIDVSGGWTDYQAGTPFRTTRLMSNGQLINIEDATPDRLYDGVYTGLSMSTHQKWGIARTFATPLAPLGADSGQAYIQGADAGSIVIEAPSMILDGDMLGRSVIGPRQIRTSSFSSSLPAQSSVAIRFRSQFLYGVDILDASPTPPTILLQAGASSSTLSAFSVTGSGEPAAIPSDRQEVVNISQALFGESGFGSVEIENLEGDIKLPKGVVVQTHEGGGLKLAAANVSVEGSIISPGGSIDISAYNYSPFAAALIRKTVTSAVEMPALPDRGRIEIASGAVLSAAGTMLDERTATVGAALTPIAQNGGTVSLSGYDVSVARGSTLDVSGGMTVSPTGKFSFGKGGQLTVAAGQDLAITSVLGGELKLEGTLLGYSAVQGGTLSIKAPLIQVGGVSPYKEAFVVQPGFFNEGGFNAFKLTGIGMKIAGSQAEDFVPAVFIAPGTVIAPRAQATVVQPLQPGQMNVAYTHQVLPDGVRQPVDLEFAAPGVTNAFDPNVMDVRGDIVFSPGAKILADPGSDITLKGNTVSIFGSIVAPGGSITIAGRNSFPYSYFGSSVLPTAARTTVYLAPSANLSTAGAVVYAPDPYGRRVGTVFGGGTIAISGNIYADEQATLDVSGASGVFDLTLEELGLSVTAGQMTRSGVTSAPYGLMGAARQLDTNAGSITLTGGEMLYAHARLIGKPGGDSALGGSLTVSSGRFYPTDDKTSADLNLFVTQNDTQGIQTIKRVGDSLASTSGATLLGGGFFSVDTFNDGGFASLTLGGNVQFSGPVTIAAAKEIRVARGGVFAADAHVDLTAPYVALGQAYRTPILPTETFSYFTKTTGTTSGESNFAPTFGPGSLSVHADLIDLGALSFQGVGSIALDAPGGQIRGGGPVDFSGSLTMRAAAIYPVSGLDFAIYGYGYNDGGTAKGSVVSIERAGLTQSPLSAQGSLAIYAATINQSGVLLAPFGQIALGWDGVGTSPIDPIARTSATIPTTSQVNLGSGSVTSVSGLDYVTGAPLLVPYGLNPDGLAWLDPSGFDITSTGLSGKSVSIAGAAVNFASGATIDIRGGGDLFSYRWVQGNGGSSDILASEDSFAIVPGYTSNFAPYAPFNTSSAATALEGDTGYVNDSLSVGDSIYLQASAGLPAGEYTLLPARYALLPGAFLVSRKSASVIGSYQFEDGSSTVPGYTFNTAQNGAGKGKVYSQFEVLPSSVVASRAEYEVYSANSFFTQVAAEREQTVSPIPADAGQLAFRAISSLNIAGRLQAAADLGGRGSLVDISARSNIVIGTVNTSVAAGSIFLDAAQLSSLGAESLLIGGFRTVGSAGTTVTTTATSIRVDNAGSPLYGPEIILTTSGELRLVGGARVFSTGGMTRPAEKLLLSGDGALLRVSGDESADMLRTGFSGALAPSLVMEAGSFVGGSSVILDSSNAMHLDPDAVIDAGAIALNSGQVTILLNSPGTVAATNGLVLSGSLLSNFESSSRKSLLSYSSLDIYGTGTIGGEGNLSIRAAQIRGYNQGVGGAVHVIADTLSLDNSQNGTLLAGAGATGGSLIFDSGVVSLGTNSVSISGFGNTTINASGGVIGAGSGGLSTAGSLTIAAPLITGAKGATQSITAGGQLILSSIAGGAASVSSGLGASMSFTGASVVADTDILLPSGAVTLASTAGGIEVNGLIDVSGVSRDFYDVTEYTDAGSISLAAAGGNVVIGSSGQINVSSAAGGGNAGTLSISAPQGTFTSAGALLGSAGAGWKSGTFILDISALPTLSSVNQSFSAGDFNYERSIRVRTGNVIVDGTSVASKFTLAADQGSVTVTGSILASGETGGAIALYAHGNLTLANGSLLDASGRYFSSAGKGGSVDLGAGATYNGVAGTGTLDIQTGSKIDLSVASLNAGSRPSSFYGDYSGALHLRAPQTTGSTDLSLNPVRGDIVGASAIIVEGYRVFDLTSVSGLISATGSTVQAQGGAITSANVNVRESIRQNGVLFGGNDVAISSRLFTGANAGLASIAVISPGAEILNRNANGNITLGTTTSTTSQDWNLSTYRFGSKSAPGIITMRTAGNLVFYNTMSDGFQAVTAAADNGWSTMWLAPLMARNNLLPGNVQSYSYNLAAGADLTSANTLGVLPMTSLGSELGSVQIGKNLGQAIGTTGANATTARIIGSSSTAANNFNVIRTGTGDINIAAGRDVQLLNQFATIYTAGVRVASANSIYAADDFSVPVLVDENGFLAGTTQGALGNYQQVYPAQYSMAGGNVSVFAQRNIGHYTRNGSSTTLIADSSRQIPTNWLMRRSYIDGSGNYGSFTASGNGTSITDPSASTSWWVDFSNFFEGVGALGGGNVTLKALQDVVNVDAVAPTNARAPKGVADASLLLELGGGNVTVSAGRNIDGGIYYVESGVGTLTAGGQIKTNSTRSPSLGLIKSLTSPEVLDESTWLPTTLFAGKAIFNVSARGDVLLGPTLNAFLVPQGLTNRYWYRSAFSTYGADTAVNVTSLGGSVNLRYNAIPPTSNASLPIFQYWLQQENLYRSSAGNTIAAAYYPWIRLGETSVDPFSTALSVLPPTLDVTAFSGNISIAGNLTLYPAAAGNLSLKSAGSINGLQRIGQSNNLNAARTVLSAWMPSTITVSDASPSLLPGIASSISNLARFSDTSNLLMSNLITTSSALFTTFDRSFNETATTTSVIQTKQALHASGLLHTNDSEPVRLYAAGGDILDVTLFAPKQTRILASNDIRDIAFYIQNVSEDDYSLVQAGRDIVLYDANTPGLIKASASGSALLPNSLIPAGDIQISGPGALGVFAGRNIDLGVGSTRSNGTGVGITSIGNSRNPYLPFYGADVTVAAGLNAEGLIQNLDVDGFLAKFAADGPDSAYLSEALASMATDGGKKDLSSLSDDEKRTLAFKILFQILRDTGRAYATAGNYDAGFSAISALIETSGEGNLNLRGRDVRTRNGGDITLLAPAGSLSLASTTIGNPLAPPGIVTERGGAISILTRGDVDLGIGRIFTLRGGNIIIWSSEGDIAAGSSPKTVRSAPPTRVVIDPQTATVETDLAGLATGGGIGVLASVVGVPPGDVDLIAPSGSVDAGDAGIRATGNLSIAAVEVLNADNISVAGSTTGVPTTAPPAAPNIAGLSSASSSTAATASASNEMASQNKQQAAQDETPSVITVDVLGYGGGDDEAVPDTRSVTPQDAAPAENSRDEDEQNKPRPTGSA